ALPAAQVRSDEAPGDLLQGGEVEMLDPLFPHEATQQVRYHLGMGKKQLVSVIVVSHRRSARHACKRRGIISGNGWDGKGGNSAPTLLQKRPTLAWRSGLRPTAADIGVAATARRSGRQRRANNGAAWRGLDSSVRAASG